MAYNPASDRSLPIKLLATIALVFALDLSQSLLVPVLIGVLVSYVLSPIVDKLTAWRVPRGVASGLVIGALMGAIGTLGYRLSDEAMAALRSVPEASARLREVAQRVVGRRPSVVHELQSAADAVASAADGGQRQRRAGQPLPVQIVEPSIDVKQYVWLGWQGLFGIGSQVLLVLFLSFFMLSSGDLFRRKLVRLAGTRLSHRRLTVEVLNEVGDQISRFLMHQALTGFVVGVVTWLALWWLGLDYAPLWGIAAGVLNSVPYFGPTVVAIAIFVAAFLQFDSAWQAGLASFMSLVITTLEGMLLTPLLVSRFARMNPVAVFLGLLFWGWLWGVVGLLLAVPLLMVVKSVADRVDDLKPLGELLGE
jgi:predicted PurR-regulated permease PerM